MSKILKVLKGPLSTLGKKNRNGRIYSKELWEHVLKSEYWDDMIKNNTLCGEVVHPGERTESDPFEIDVRNISHRVTEAHIEGDKLVGTVEILDTEQGRNLLSLVDSGCTIGISARGMGDLNGDYVVPETYNFKCFDITMRPSDPNARLVPLTESEKIKFILDESEITDNLIEAVEKPNFKDTSDVVKNTIVKRLFEELNSRNTEGIQFKKIPGSIKFISDDKGTGNFFVVKAITDEGQPERYKIFSNRDKSLGYIDIPLSNGYPSINYSEVADTLLQSINKLASKNN